MFVISASVVMEGRSHTECDGDSHCNKIERWYTLCDFSNALSSIFRQQTIKQILWVMLGYPQDCSLCHFSLPSNWCESVLRIFLFYGTRCWDIVTVRSQMSFKPSRCIISLKIFLWTGVKRDMKEPRSIWCVVSMGSVNGRSAGRFCRHYITKLSVFLEFHSGFCFPN